MEALRDLQRMQELLISEIRFGRATLPECCNHIAGHMPEPYRSCLIRIYERMREMSGIVFGQVFREEMKVCLETLPVTEGDRNCFLELFSDGDGGYEDGSMQIRTIEQSRELLQHTINGLERENAEKCRMAVGLGAMSGLLLLVILI